LTVLVASKGFHTCEIVGWAMDVPVMTVLVVDAIKSGV
jgi:hypothetical protein